MTKKLIICSDDDKLYKRQLSNLSGNDCCLDAERFIDFNTNKQHIHITNMHKATKEQKREIEYYHGSKDITMYSNFTPNILDDYFESCTEITVLEGFCRCGARANNTIDGKPVCKRHLPK